MKNFILPAIIILLQSTSCINKSKAEKEQPNLTILQYACMPCGLGCDTVTYNKPGTCSNCKMQLVDKSTITHKNIPPEKMCMLDEKNVIFIDVRTVDEFNGTAPEKFGTIKNAVNIPVQELEARVKELLPYKEKEIVVYCSHSHRSPRASYMLTQNGFKNVTNMTGGMSVWQESVKQNDCNNKLFVKQ